MKKSTVSCHEISPVLFILSVLIMAPNSSFGYTRLTTTADAACLGESVVHICTTSGYSLSWRVTLVDRTIPPQARLFQSSDNIGKTYSVTSHGLQLHFVLISNVPDNINSTFAAQTVMPMHGAIIQCQGEETRQVVFRIAYTPSKPVNINISHKSFNSASFSVTLRWDSSVERVHMYSINTSVESNLLMVTSTNTTAIEIADIPYNRQIRVSIASINCYSESVKAKFNFIINSCNETNLTDITVVRNSFFNIPGEQLLFACKSGYLPIEVMTAVCQEDGLWSPDPNELICTFQCRLPILNEQIMVEPNSSTEMGSMLRFKCKDGLIPEDYAISVCSNGGLWLPDPEEHPCHPMTTIFTEFYPETNVNRSILIGSLMGVTLLGLIFCFFIGIATCIIHLRKKGERDHSEREMPMYDTISPDYEIVKQKNILNLTVNDAYSAQN